MLKNILIVSAYFFPDITPRSFRTTELVKELCTKGHSVTLYIPYREFDYSAFLKEYPIKIKFINANNSHPNLPSGSNILAKCFRFLYYKFSILTEYPHIKLYYKIPQELAKEKGYDLLISIAAPHAVNWGVAKSIKRNKELAHKWIADCGDPFMGNRTRIKPNYFRSFEKQFCKFADFITVPLEAAKECYYPEFRHKIEVIPQGFDLSNKKDFIKTTYNSIPTFAYAGIFYNDYRDPTPFFDFLSKINEDFKFILYTKKNSLTKKLKSKLEDKLIIKDFMPRDSLLAELAQMDFLVNFENRTKGQAPSKLIDYYIANRPILNVPFGNFDEDIIHDFLKGNYSKQFRIENIDDFDIKNVSQKFMSL